MKKIVLFLVILLSFLIQAGAQTVMISVRRTPVVSRVLEEEYTAHMEDGIMDLLFDSGFIVFNTDFGILDGSPLGDDVTITANAGGADFLLQVDLTYLQLEKGIRPEQAEFSYRNLVSSRTMVKGRIRLDDLPSGEKNSVLDSCYYIGKRIAGLVLQSGSGSR